MIGTNNFRSVAIERNNAGIALIANGRYEDAISQLIQANLTVRSLFDTDDDTSCSENDNQKQTHPNVSLIDQMILDSQRARQKQNPEDREYYVYDQPIQIPASLSCNFFEMQEILSTTVLFNLALAYHLAAVNSTSQSPTWREVMLRRALKIYEVAFQLHNFHREDCMGKSKTQVSNLLLLSLMNNCGHVYHSLHQCEDSNQCFQHLYASLLWLKSNTSLCCCNASQQQEDIISGYLQSATTWLQKSSLHDTAAAAA